MYCKRNEWTDTTLPISKVSNVCPANSTQSGTSCICNTGFNEENGRCVAPDPCKDLAAFCASKKGARQNYAVWDNAADTFCYVPPDDLFWDQPKYPGCNQGCMGQTIGMTVGTPNDAGRMLYRGEGSLTGGKCTEGISGTAEAPGTQGTEKDPAINSEDCAGFKGTVNGVTACIPATSATGVDWTGTTTNPDGTKTETTTTTTCTNGVCTSTTTKTNKDATGATTGTSSSTDKVSQTAYCTKNPGNAVCAAVSGTSMPGAGGEGAKSKFGGSCASGFTCEGDGIQCAIAKEQHARNCQIDALKDSDLYKAWEAVKDFGDKNVTKNLPGNKTHDITIASNDEFIGAGSCPADRVIDMGSLGSFTLPFSELCPWLQIMGYVFVILCSIQGGLIIIRRQT